MVDAAEHLKRLEAIEASMYTTLTGDQIDAIRKFLVSRTFLAASLDVARRLVAAEEEVSRIRIMLLTAESTADRINEAIRDGTAVRKTE